MPSNTRRDPENRIIKKKECVSILQRKLFGLGLGFFEFCETPPKFLFTPAKRMFSALLLKSAQDTSFPFYDLYANKGNVLALHNATTKDPAERYMGDVAENLERKKIWCFISWKYACIHSRQDTWWDLLYLVHMEELYLFKLQITISLRNLVYTI